MAPADKSSSPEPPKREAGGGCPPPSCSYPSTRCNSPNADCSSTASSCCPWQCRYPQQAPSLRASDCQPCALKSILKKRSCCHDTSCCLCQPMPRGCNCPPPIQVDVRAVPEECSCECPSSPECACPPSERRFPKATIKCPNARLCNPSPRLPPDPKCHCPRCQPCPPPPPPPPPCDSCTSSFKCRRSVPAKNSCRSTDSPCPSCPPCRPISTASPCRPPTPCRKLTFCTERGERRLPSPCTGQSWRGIIGDKSTESSEQNDDDERREIRDTKDRDRCYATDDYVRSDGGSELYTDRSRDLILDEESMQKSKTAFDDLSETTNPSKSVDPESCDMPEELDEKVAFENAEEALEACTTEKSSKDSWYTSPTHAPSDSGAKPDCYAFHENSSPAGGNVSNNKNPVLARLLNRVKLLSRLKNLSASNRTLHRYGVTFREPPRARVGSLAGASISISTISTRGIDRRRGNGGSSREDTTDSKTNVTRGVVHPVGVSCTLEGTSSAYAQTNDKKSASGCYDVFTNLGGIGYSTLVPNPLALISFVLLILVAVTWFPGSAFYHRYLLRKRFCWRYLSL